MRLRSLALVTLGLVAMIVPGRTVSAHTELDFTLPAEGTTVGEPVSEISVGFTEAVTLVGNGFEVLDPQGNVLQPFVVTDDDKVFRLQLDPPLAGGPVGVSYRVTAADGHVVEGAFSFTAAAEPPAPTTAAPATTAPVAVTEPAATVGPTTAATTAPAVATSAPTTISVPATATSVDESDDAADSEDDTEDDTARTVIIVVLVAAALGAAAFLVLRSRRPS